MGSFDEVKYHTEKLEQCINITHVAAKLLIYFSLDDNFNDAIPGEVKNNYIRGGLLDSIVVAAGQAGDSIERLLAAYVNVEYDGNE